MDISLFKTRGSHHQWGGGRVVVCCGCSTECGSNGGWWSNQRSICSGSREVVVGVTVVDVVVEVVGGIGIR